MLILWNFILTCLIMMVGFILLIVPGNLNFMKETPFNKMSPYECGFDSAGLNRLPFSVQFFLIAIIFLVFDVEICLLFPLVINSGVGLISLWMFIFFMFVLILLVGTVHEWNQGALDWKM